MEKKIYSLNDGREVTIRPINSKDREQLISLYEAASGRFDQEALSPQQIKEKFQFPDYYINLVTEHDGKIIGYGEIKEDPKKQNGELQIRVHPNAQRMGLGTAMMIMLLKDATEKKLKKINLKVASENSAAIALFRKFGFQQDYMYQETNNHGENHDMIRMTHVLRGK